MSNAPDSESALTTGELLERARQILSQAGFESPLSAPAISRKRQRGRPELPRITALDNVLVAIVQKHGRIMVRSVFYQAVGVKAVEKTENAAVLVQRELLKL